MLIEIELQASSPSGLGGRPTDGSPAAIPVQRRNLHRPESSMRARTHDPSRHKSIDIETKIRGVRDEHESKSFLVIQGHRTADLLQQKANHRHPQDR